MAGMADVADVADVAGVAALPADGRVVVPERRRAPPAERPAVRQGR
ncbi:MAG TPA: hypothetical protein VMZ73_10565 [Acidimicrobiales bacterium]|nr:hypothetical protein [Acidimicrobiales bacterium]